MKTLKTILASTILLSTGVVAMTDKVSEPSKKVYDVVKGDTKGQISKNGLAVDLSYKSEHVDVSEISKVHITLTTSLKVGDIKVKLLALDDKLEGIDEENLEFKISDSQNTFPIDLEVSSVKEGIHYINIETSVEKEGSRVFVVPVKIGTISKKIESKAVDTTKDGKVISISNAQEEIK